MTDRKKGFGSLTNGALVQLQDNDVLMGRGSGIAKHPGNIHFRRLVDLYRAEYHATERNRKQYVALQIITAIESASPPGRFVEARGAGHVLVSAKRALEKTSQALREKLPAGNVSRSTAKSHAKPRRVIKKDLPAPGPMFAAKPGPLEAAENVFPPTAISTAPSPTSRTNDDNVDASAAPPSPKPAYSLMLAAQAAIAYEAHVAARRSYYENRIVPAAVEAANEAADAPDTSRMILGRSSSTSAFTPLTPGVSAALVCRANGFCSSDMDLGPANEPLDLSRQSTAASTATTEAVEGVSTPVSDDEDDEVKALTAHEPEEAQDDESSDTSSTAGDDQFANAFEKEHTSLDIFYFCVRNGYI